MPVQAGIGVSAAADLTLKRKGIMKNFLSKALLFAVLLSPAFLTGCGKSIETGNVGVEKTFTGKVSPEELSPGFHWNVFDTIYEYSGKEITIGLDNLRPKAKDNLSLDKLDVVLAYEVSPGFAPKIQTEFKGVTTQDEDGVYLPAKLLVENATEEAAQSAVSQHDSLIAHTKRAEIAAEIKRLVQAKLDSRMAGAFKVKNVAITSLVTDKGIENSIRAKATATNDLQAMEARLQKAQKDAELNKALNTTYTAEYLQHEKNVAMQKCADNPNCTLIVVDDNFKGSVMAGRK